jgi:hypothetical protein
MNDELEVYLPCYHDNRLRQLTAWMQHPAVQDERPEPARCLEWLIEQPSNAQFRAVMFRVVSLPVYGKDQWFLLGWRERTPCYPQIIEPLPFGIENATADYLRAGHVVRLEAIRRGELWDILVVRGNGI